MSTFLVLFEAIVASRALSPLSWAVDTQSGGWTLFEASSDQWYSCPSNTVLAGFYRSDCQTLTCLEEMRCVAPLNPAPSFDRCYDEDIREAFDGDAATENVYCAAGYFIHGIEMTGSCDKLYCLETLECCRYDTSQVELYDTADKYHSWLYDFDAGAPEGWVLVDADEYITGLERTGSEGLGGELSLLEAAWTRRLKLVTPSPTPAPTPGPTRDPTPAPTNLPTRSPTREPTSIPTSDPTVIPTRDPTMEPTYEPSLEPTQDPTNEPTKEPSAEPTSIPTTEPTADPTCGAQRHLIWADLLLQGADYEALPEVSYELDVDQLTDTLSVDLFLPYLGSSQRDEDSAANLGTTYFISFRAFSSDDTIANPGNCDNRDAAAFVNKSWAESWRFDEAGATIDSLGSAQFLAYGPSNFWSVSPDGRYPDCVERVHYAAEFPLPDLLGCVDAAGAPSIEVVTNDAWMNVSGSLFVSVLSPLTMSFESSSYLQYQLLSAPFSMAISKSVYLLDAIDTFVFSASPLAVYREAEGHYVMLLLTESAEFVALEGLSVLDPAMQSSVAAEEAECIAEQNYICSQVWVVDITNVACPFSLDGDYAFQFTAVCDDDGSAAECEQFVQDNGDSVTLSTQLSFADTMCNPEVWTLQYDGAVSFYADDSFDELADADAAYRSLTDRVFVELRVDIPNSNANFSLYDVELYNVWLCTSPSELTLDADAVDSTGCFDSRVDGLSPYHIIKNYDATLSSGAAHEEMNALNTARFSFVVPAGVAEGAVYIEMQALLTLRSAGEQGPGRRRLLTEEQESSQLQLFMGSITVSDDGVEEEPASQGQEPLKETSDDYLLVVVVILALLLAVCGVGALAAFIRARRKSASSETGDAVVLSQVVAAKTPSDDGEIAK